MKVLKRRKNNRFTVITLGCEKNLVDSEELIGNLTSRGWHFVHSPQKADRVFVNTCAFIQEARQDSIETLSRVLELKQENPELKVYATGCLVKHPSQSWRYSLPGQVDGFWASLEDILRDLTSSPFAPLCREPLVPPWYAYIKISEGCSRPCSFCVIPQLRGTHRSKPLRVLQQEAEGLLRRGVQEVILVAQDSTLYGKDLQDASVRLPDVLRLMSGLGFRWIRLFYLYPDGVTEELLEAFGLPGVLPYFDLPFQHASPRILSAMRREGSIDSYEALVENIRNHFPSSYIRTSIIVGFPGETEEDFEAVLSFLKRWKFDGVSAFAYSAEEGTKAFSLPEPVPPKERENRLAELTRVQNEIGGENLSRWIGQRTEAVVEKIRGVAVGRTWFQAPDVDGTTILNTRSKPGEFITVNITDAVEYDLYGEEVNPPS